jgi:hypothetical protein
MQAHPHGRQARLIPAAEAAALVRSGDWLDYGAALGQPDVFVWIGVILAQLRLKPPGACLP